MKGMKPYLEKLWLKRQATWVDRMLLTAAQSLRPTWAQTTARRLDPLCRRLRVQFVTCADTDPDHFRRLQYGDTWVKYELMKILGARGYIVTDREPDVAIHLFGKVMPLPEQAYKICWIYSHPEHVTPKVLEPYDRIFCLSGRFCEEVRRMGFEAECLPGATAKQPVDAPVERDVLFVGNARSDGHRAIVDALRGADADYRVIGRGYRDLPPEHWEGPYVDYAGLDRLYASSRIVLNDHWPDMAHYGFVAVRVFDILASGGFCLSDRNPGLEERLGDAVPQYESPEELQSLIRYYIDHEDERREKASVGRVRALAHNWADRAEQLMSGFSPEYKMYNKGCSRSKA